MKRTLALLFPPGLIGGYRNQVIRLIGFVHYAITQEADQLLLPTILFGTKYKDDNDQKRFFPVPMSSLFDIQHWNSFSDHLPILVESIDDGDCWEANQLDWNNTLVHATKTDPAITFVSPMARQILQTSAFLRPLYNISHDFLMGSFHANMRRLDLLPHVKNCSRPMVYGGGIMAGRLWEDYIQMLKARPGKKDNTSNVSPLTTSTSTSTATELISYVSRALIPKKEWREVALQCIRNKNQPNHSTTTQPDDGDMSELVPYIALHARVESDMMVHRCSKKMEKNLTKIFDMVESFLEDREEVSSEKEERPLRVFIAVSRQNMQKKINNPMLEKLREENWIALNSHESRPRRRRRPSTIFECGEEWIRQWYLSNPTVQYDYFGSVLPSILDFHIATQASIFIGVSKSSWSTDVWTTRYYQGLGSGNFEYSPNGIFAVPNGGLPAPHQNC